MFLNGGTGNAIACFPGKSHKSDFLDVQLTLRHHRSLAKVAHSVTEQLLFHVPFGTICPVSALALPGEGISLTLDCREVGGTTIHVP